MSNPTWTATLILFKWKLQTHRTISHESVAASYRENAKQIHEIQAERSFKLTETSSFIHQAVTHYDFSGVSLHVTLFIVSIHIFAIVKTLTKRMFEHLSFSSDEHIEICLGKQFDMSPSCCLPPSLD